MAVSDRVAVTVQLPPMSARSKFDTVNDPPLSGPPTFIVAPPRPPHCTVPAAVMLPEGTFGKETTRVPVFGSGLTVASTLMPRGFGPVVGHWRSVPNAGPVTVIIADGWPVGKTVTMGVYS